MNIPAGSTNVSLFAVMRSTTDNSEVTTLLYSDITGSYSRTAAARVAVTMATQTVTGAHSDGGFVAVDTANCPGLYRFDAPDAAFAAGADEVAVSLASPGVYTFHRAFSLDPSPVNATDTVQASAATSARTVNLSSGLNIHEGSVGVVYTGPGVGSAFVVHDYSTPSTTVVKAPGLAASLNTTSKVVFFAGPPGLGVDDLNDFDPASDQVEVSTNNDKTGYSLAGFDAVSATSSIASIKAQTDQLNYTVANRVDANTTHINEVAIQGSGTTASPFRP